MENNNVKPSQIYAITNKLQCKNCNGSGHINQQSCNSCDGTGWADKKPRLAVIAHRMDNNTAIVT